MSNTYPSYKSYLASDAYAYPAANRSDGGDDNSEKNLKLITDKFAIKGFIVRRKLPEGAPEYFEVTFNHKTKASTMTIDRGECSAGGYYLDLKKMSASFTELALKIDTYYNITIFCVLDAAGLFSGDGVDIVGSQSGKTVSRGVRLQMLTDDELSSLDSRYPYVLLGRVKTTVDGYFDPTTYVPDVARYSFIDSTTILTPGGIPIEVWVEQRIKYEITHLDQLNYYLNDDDDESSACFKIVPVYDRSGKIISYDVVFERETTNEEDYPSNISLSEIEQRTRPSGSGEYLEHSGLKTGGKEGSTYNGTSDEIARADHLHDNRYLHKLESSTQQQVKSPVKFTKRITASGGVSGSGFDINDDGSASLGGKKLNVDNNGNITSVGNVTSTGDITAKRVFNAVWNDYAELYRKEDPGQIITPGTVIAKVPGKDAYAPVTEYNRNLVVGVCSDSYGHLLGGDQVDVNENLRNFIPVALAGRVSVKVVKDAIIREGDLMVASAVQGRATTCTQRREQYGMIIGKALESSDGSKDKILIQVFLG